VCHDSVVAYAFVLCSYNYLFLKLGLRNHSVIFLRGLKKKWERFGHYIRPACHLSFCIRASTLKGLWGGVGVCCVAEVRSFDMWFASIETLASVIASTRDHAIQLHWTVHDQIMLVHKSDTRDKSEKVHRVWILDLFHKVLQLSRLSNFEFWGEL